MIDNPFLPSPSGAAAWAEGFVKGYVAISSPAPSDSIGGDDFDAFNQGVQSGSDSAANGIELGDPCIAAADEHGPLHAGAVAIDAAHIVHGVWELRQLATMAGGVAGIMVAVVCLAATLPHRTLPPEDVLPSLGEPLAAALSAYGVDSMVLFCGAGLDALSPDCEIKLTPVFTNLDAARQAAQSMNRSQWIAVSWRTDQSNSFAVEDSG
jgi:hypothetical protein